MAPIVCVAASAISGGASARSPTHGKWPHWASDPCGVAMGKSIRAPESRVPHAVPNGVMFGRWSQTCVELPMGAEFRKRGSVSGGGEIRARAYSAGSRAAAGAEPDTARGRHMAAIPAVTAKPISTRNMMSSAPVRR